MKCYTCDFDLGESWNYCPNCKRRIKHKKSLNEDEFVGSNENGKCKKCSCELDSSWNFCPVCSSKNDFACEIKIKDELIKKEQKYAVKREKKKIGICNNCKTAIFENELYCSKCEAEVKINKENGKVETKSSDPIYNLYLSLCVFSFILIILFGFADFDILNIISCILFLCLCILFKFKYPKDVWANVLFYGFIVFGILSMMMFDYFADLFFT